MKLCPDCGNDCLPYELRRWGKCLDCKGEDND